MATAVETSTQPSTPKSPAGLAFASLVGAAYVLAALAVVCYAIPSIWGQLGTTQLGFVDDALRIAVQAVVGVVLAWFGNMLAGSSPPKGVRGGIFLMISAAVAIGFIVRAVGLWTSHGSLEGTGALVVTGVVGVVLIFLAFRLFTSPRGERWMLGLEEQGWFHTSAYKRVLGQRVRRLTILGILLIGGSGVYSLMDQSMLPESWSLTLPFTQQAGAADGVNQTLPLLSNTRFSVPLLLIGLTLWIAYRAVNMPMFAEFLIATEAEMNKVSWSTRRRLAQDTAVVLVTTVLIAMFLFFMDIFWGWLLSRNIVGVLPSKSTAALKAGQVQEAKW